MPRFLARETDVLVSTSYKVMYSSLVKTGLFDEIGNAAFAALAAERCRGGGNHHLMAVRDPYARLASFFADKLRQDLKRSSGRFQFCQVIFFPLIGLAHDASFEEARDALRAISFDAFIDFLPRICADLHLQPQVGLLDAAGLDLGPCTRIFRIETEAAMFWQAIGVRRPPWSNRSRTLPSVKTLTRDRLDIVNSVYAADFTRFGYDRL